jgi:hypothetical protein
MLLLTLLLALAITGVWYASAKSAAANTGASTPAAATAPSSTHTPTTASKPGSGKTASGPSSHHRTTEKAPATKKRAKPKAHTRSARPKAHTRSGRPTAPAKLLTQAIAQQAFSATWIQFAIAANADTTSLLRLATPSVVELAEANRACNCGQFPIKFGPVELTAPVETTYPLSFAAEIDDAKGAHGTFTVLAVLEKDSASAGWQVAWVVKYQGTAPTLLSGDSIGTSRPLVVEGTLTSPITAVAGLFQSLSSTGRDASGNIWVGDLNTRGTEPSDTAATLMAAYKAAVARHASDAAIYSATNFSMVFASRSGYLECGQIEGTVVETPTRASYLVQPANQSVYGPMLAPGRYASVTGVDARDFCVVVSVENVVTAIGLAGGTYEVSGDGS